MQRTDGEVVVIDGKTLCSSYWPGERKSAIHMLSAFATANGVVMGPVKTGEKSGEYQAIPELLKLLEIKGCYVVIAEAILARKADYLLAVKGSQPNLRASIQAAFRSTDVVTEVTMRCQYGRTEY
ncbi:MAG: ISAs1 family transposase [Gammaproteobacteria bacterium]|nr:ISAs1 family transposase [Gammaproteobacteria bacterium]